MLVHDAGWNHSDKSHDGLHNLDDGTNNLASGVVESCSAKERFFPKRFWKVTNLNLPKF